VVLDGVDTGRFTPLVDVRVKPGRHVVRVEDPVTGKAGSRSVDVEAGRSDSVSLALRAWSDDERRSALADEAALRPVPAAADDVDAGVVDAGGVVAPWQDADDDGAGAPP
jgi:hypothetical protein